MGHISALRSRSVREDAATWGTLTLTPGSAGVSHHGGAVARAGRRGLIGDLSARSRRRLMFALAAVEWPDRPYGLLTLTYPGEYPADPTTWHAQLDAFRSRWERHFGPLQAAWVLEFQQRGAPHWHLVVALPDARLPLLRRWISLAWYQIVGSGDARHLAAGTQLKEAQGPRGAAGYLFKELGKSRQKELPAGVDAAGRWWGIWRLTRATVELDLSDGEFYAIRRVLRRLAAGRKYRPDLGRRQGLTVLERYDAGIWQLGNALGRLVAGWRLSAGT